MSHQRFAERKKMSNPFLERENVLYLNSERCSTFYIERNENNCQGYQTWYKIDQFPVKAFSFK